MKRFNLNFFLRLAFCYLFLNLLLTSPLSLSAQVYPGDLMLDSQAAVDAFSYTEVTGNIDISGADINNLNSLSSLVSVGGTIRIHDNPALTNLDGLAALSLVEGYLTIWNNALLANIDGLSTLNSVGGLLSIVINPSLANIDGLSALNFAGLGIWISENNAITNIDGLSALNSIGDQGSLSIEANALLTNIDGLSGLTSLERHLTIQLNPSLTNIDGLSPMTSVGGSVSISANATLGNIDGLSALTTVGEKWYGYLQITHNPLLTHLDGLSSLNSLGGDLNISANATLTNLDGLSSLSSMQRYGYMSIGNNPVLGGFCGLYNLFDSGWSGTYSIYGNLDNPTKEDITAGGPCTLDPVQIIASLLDDGILKKGQANALSSILNTCRLNAFNNLVNAWVNAGILTEEQANDLSTAATQHCGPASRMGAQRDQAFSLGQNYPNPVINHTVIPFTLATAGKVSIQLFDASGKMIRNLMDHYLMEGAHEVKVNLQSIPAGTYFYKLQVGEYIKTLPMIVD